MNTESTELPIEGKGIFSSAEDILSHFDRFGTSGKGKSVFRKRARDEARRKGHFLADSEMYEQGTGLLPYEHEVARRLACDIHGKLPRSCRRIGCHAVLIGPAKIV